MSRSSIPIVSRKGSTTSLRYELPNRVNVARVYPIRSEQDHTIVIYGHTTGISVIWRGGLPFRPGATKMSDAFEPVVPELDPSKPYEDIIQDFHFPLGAEVLDFSFPPIPQTGSENKMAPNIPKSFLSRLVLAAACSDCVVRIMMLQTTPPLDSMKDSWDAVMVSQLNLAEIPTSVSITWAVQEQPAPKKDREANVDMEPFPSVEGEDGTAGGEPLPRFIDLYVVAGSGSSSGAITFGHAQLEFESDGIVFEDDPVPPFQKVALSTPPVAASFSSATYPHPNYSHVLVAQSTGIVGIYNPFKSRLERSASDSKPPGGMPATGSWVTSLSTPLATTSSDEASFGLTQRKRILDAKWVLHGRAIITLLADGEWGIWSIDDSLPRVHGFGTNGSFSLWGSVGANIPKSVSRTSLDKAKTDRLSLAPMTPKTRRTKEESLFGGLATPGSTKWARGGINALEVPLLSGSGTEDTVMVWYDNAVFSISSLQKFWGQLVKKGNLVGGLTGLGLMKLETPDFHNQFISSIDRIPVADYDSYDDEEAVASVRHELLFSTQQELIVQSVLGQRSADQINTLLARQFQPHSLLQGGQQKLLDQGELDLGGLDLMMESMEEDTFMSGALPSRGLRTVGFSAS